MNWLTGFWSFAQSITCVTALWFGILTSISPCPLATNIAAISFISRKVEKMRAVLLSGLLYAVGRTVAYLALGTLIMAGLLASGEIALFLQKYLNLALGPILILVGMLLLGLLASTASVTLVRSGVQARATKGGIGWAALLGVLFALSFCPVSAGLFFGILIPLSAANPHISQNFVARACKALLRGRKLVKRRSSRIDILQSGVLPIRAVAVALSAFAAGSL